MAVIRFVIPLAEVEKNLMPGYTDQSKWVMEHSATSKESLHNHNPKKGSFVYAGFSLTAPAYHLFKCTQSSIRPARAIKMLLFEITPFSRKSKAGRCTCSMRLCPGEAVQMNERRNRAYCQDHADEFSAARLPCQATSIFPCLRLFNGEPTCNICTSFKEEAS